MIELFDGITTTRAIRRYTDEPVSDEDLAKILFAATRAPSGSNRQPFRFLVLKPAATEARGILKKAAEQIWSMKRVDDSYEGADPTSPKARMARTMEHYTTHLDEAPVIILAALKRYRDANPFEGASVYPACQNILLAARALGLGGVMTQMQILVDAELKEALGIPEEIALHGMITIGHPAGNHGPVRRRPLTEMVYENRWGQPAAWAVDPEGTRHTQAGPPPKSPRSR